MNLLRKRVHSSAKIIAITGSAGKTSLKNLIKDLLLNFGDTLHSPKSYISIRCTHKFIFLTPNHSFGVFEVGMSKAGNRHTYKTYQTSYWNHYKYW